MGSTLNLLLPYPDPSDPVANGDDVIKALAQRVEALAGAAGGLVLVASPIATGNGTNVTPAVTVNIPAAMQALVTATGSTRPRVQATAFSGGGALYVAFLTSVAATTISVAVRRIDNAVIANGTQITVDVRAEVML